MRPIGLLTAGLLVAAGPVGADLAADLAAWEALKIRQVWPLSVDTPLVVEGAAAAALVPADGAPWTGAAVEIQAAVADATGVALPIIAAGDVSDADWAARSLIVLGNLSVSPVFARLYNNYFCCADAGYTGNAGYELRTIADPWGQGRNAVVIGAQATEGLANGVARLVGLIAEHGRQGSLTLPRLLELRFDPNGRRAPLVAPLDDKQVEAERAALDRIYARPGTERAGPQRTIHHAMMYHRTGDKRWLELYRYGIFRHIRYYAENEYINEAGPRRYDRDFRDSWAWKLVVTWDLLEEHPSWTDQERLAITNHVLRTVWECNLYQGWDRPERVASWRDFRSVTHNHHTWPGLADLFGGWYFQRHYGLAVADDWLTIALGMFNSCKHSSKPLEDSAAYQWIPMWHVMTHQFATGDDSYADQGHAAETGKVALMALDSLGHQPAFGDHPAITASSGLARTYGMLGYATGDGRYRWALERLGQVGADELECPRWTDVAPIPPDDLIGVAVSYLPPLHFALLGSNPTYFPAANLPYEETFDKLTLRAGWDETDDYLMLDAYAGGTHGHFDSNAIVSYVGAGAHWLVDGEYIRLAPKYHCSVTVTRDGVGEQIPPLTRLDAAAWYGDAGLVRTVMPGYNGMTWTRNLIWSPNRYVAVIDELTAEIPGTYGLRCCWRVLGEPTLEGDTLRVRQYPKGFTLRNLSGQRQGLVYIKDASGWPVHHLYQRHSATLAAGETVRFINVFRAGVDASPEIEAVRCGDTRAAITIDGEREMFGVGGLAGAGIETDAEVYRLSTATAWLAASGQWRHGDGAIDLPEPRCGRIDGAGLTLGEPQPTPQQGQRAVVIVPASQPDDRKLDLSAAVAELSAPQPANPPPAATALREASPLAVAWRAAGFQARSVPLRPIGVVAEPAPHPNYRPVERLIDGRYSSSTNSCFFPVGEDVRITIDLGAEEAIREVRIRAWEMSESWLTKDRRLSLSNDNFADDERVVEGEFEVVGTQRWGGNVNTIYALACDQTARYVRLELSPATDDSRAYLAEIEVFGAAGTADLVALTSGDVDGDGVDEAVIGSGAGEIAVFTAGGELLWRTDVQGPVTALAAGDLTGDGRASVVYGAAPATLGVIDPRGLPVADLKPPAYRGIDSRVEDITIADLDGDGQPSIVIGVRSWQYLAYTPDLKLTWKCVIYAHGATVAAIDDLDGDGQLETVAGNAYYRLNIIDPRGKMRLQAGRFGPEQSAVATGDLDGDGRGEVVLGTDVGTLLAFNLAGELQWEKNVGDRVTTVLIERDPARVIAASETGFVWCFGGDGEERWRLDLGEPVTRLVRARDGYLAAASSAGVVLVSSDGRVGAVAATPTDARDVTLAGDMVVATLRDGSAVGILLR